MAVSDVQRFLGQYGDMLNPYGQTAKDANRVIKQNTTTPQLSMQYNTAPTNFGMYSTLQNINPEVVNQLDFIKSPDILSSTGAGLQTIMQGSQLLGTKVGEGTLGSKLLGQNFMKGPGASITNPFTQQASSGFTGVTLDPSPIGPYMEGTASSLTGGQMASNYFSNLKAGSVSAGLPTYLVGRALRSAFDDDDPTTFAAGEMFGAGVSGAGAASALMGLSPKLAALGPAGILLGIGISIFGGKKKRDKARKLQQEYEKSVAERNEEIMNQYREGISESRQDRESQSREMDYNRQAAKFSNPYGAGQFYNEGGLTGKEKSKVAKMGRRGDTELAHINKSEARLLKMLGGAGTINPKTGLREYHFSFSHVSNAIQNVFGGATDVLTGGIDAATDIGSTALGAAANVAGATGGAAADIADAVGVDDVLEFANEEIISPVMDTSFNLIETGIDAGREVASMAANVAGDIGNLAIGAGTSIMETIGNKIVFPTMTGIANYLSGDDDDMSLPELPPLPNIKLNEENIKPNIVTIDPYGNTLPDKAFDTSLASGSAGFVRPDAVDVNNIYSQTQANV